MKLLLVNNLEPEDVEFNRPLYENLTRLADVDSVYYSDILSAERLDDACDGIVISGAPLHYDSGVLTTRLLHLQWLNDVTIPVLGICMGHQNIALLHGAQMIVDDEAELGQASLIINEPDELLDGITPEDTVAVKHSCSVSLPEGFVLLASTENCNNQVMRHAERPLYSVQFHPELTESGIKILKNFTHIVESSIPDTATNAVEI